MEQLLWIKKIFGNKLTLNRKNELIGSIEWENFFSSRAHATINGRRFVLTREFFLSKLDIYDAGNQSHLGSIMINFFNPRSDIIINGKRFELEIKNFWQSRWSWKFNGAEIISYQSNEFLSHDKGMVELYVQCNEEAEILLLLGLFVRNQFILFMMFLLILLIILLF